MDTFFRDYVNGTKTPDYNAYFSAAGLQLVNENEGRDVPGWGAATAASEGKVVVRSVNRGSSAWEGGLNVNDEIIAIDGYRVDNNDLSRILSEHQVGDKLEVLVACDGTLRTLPIQLLKDSTIRYHFEEVANPTALQQEIFNKWLNIKNS